MTALLHRRDTKAKGGEPACLATCLWGVSSAPQFSSLVFCGISWQHYQSGMAH